MSDFLHVDNVALSFAGIKALRGVSLAVEQGTMVAIIGPNGAGKTSLFNCISGFYKPQEGTIRFQGKEITRQPAHHIAHLGITRMFQNLALFEHLTVLDNLLIGRHRHFKTRWWQDMFWLRSSKNAEVEHRRSVEEIIEFLDLERYRHTPIGILPYGLRKRVELGRALATKPQLLLLDEPAAGLNQEETEDLARYLLDIKEELHITQILIEHELGFVLDLAERIAVLDFGQKIAEGPPEEIRNNSLVKQAYTGVV
ncbi:MAG: ABC transporter ATP-binding protein [Deltaproteobacteria bacterium]|nr:MAG: ABC transporter ATP-binding protein [Deltaproteobacteria bacterium]